jgi:hypothetical protein
MGEEKNIILLEGSQASPARPSDVGNVKDDDNHHSHRRGNLKSYNVKDVRTAISCELRHGPRYFDFLH